MTIILCGGDSSRRRNRNCLPHPLASVKRGLSREINANVLIRLADEIKNSMNSNKNRLSTERRRTAGCLILLLPDLLRTVLPASFSSSVRPAQAFNAGYGLPPSCLPQDPVDISPLGIRSAWLKSIPLVCASTTPRRARMRYGIRVLHVLS